MLGGINNAMWLQSFGGFFALGLLILILKWAFSSNRFRGVILPDRAGKKDAYGVLKPVLSPGNFIEAEMAKLRLADHGIRSTIADTYEGPAVMVFEKDLAIARQVLEKGK